MFSLDMEASLSIGFLGAWSPPLGAQSTLKILAQMLASPKKHQGFLPYLLRAQRQEQCQGLGHR